MRFPLLVAGNPRTFKKGAVVKLGEGIWKIITEGMKDTVLFLRDGQPEEHYITKDTALLKIPGPAVVYLEMNKPGNEYSITIYAEKIND